MVVLFTKWARYFARYWLLEQHWIQAGDTARLSVMLTGVRYGVVFYLGIVGLAGVDSTLPAVLSVFIELLLLLWAISFWRNFQKSKTTPTGKSTRGYATVLSVCKRFSYAVVGGGIVMDLLGYGSFSVYWYVSWGTSLVIMLWGGMFFLLLKEWRQQLKTQTADVVLDEDTAGQPFKWFVLQLSWLIGFGVILVLLIFAWGGRQAVIVNMVNVLNYPINIGKINFSIMNVIYAGIVLVFTHTLARFWRFVLREKILAESGLNTGLQDSIIMISVYAVWAFGIMLSLHTFGMGTTTLAFAFGALGIGLGFGLQNIFNNFISGIILLFERPIQVGDDVEINGIWATVKKINVRATVVQTYDNASIIIPNSEFISSQVTNCSVFIIQHSILVAGATLFVSLYILTSPAAPAGVLRFLESILMVVLFTKWARFFARYWLLEQHWIQAGDTARLSVMLTGVRYGVVFYLCIVGLAGVDSTLPAVLSVFIGLLLLLWATSFWRNFQKSKTTPTGKSPRGYATVLSVCKVFSYAVVGGGIVMGLLGYGSFSVYWYVSWGTSLVIMLWGGIFFLLLKEWRQHLKAQAADVVLDEDTAGQPFKWFVLQLSWLVGFGLIFVLLIFSWGGRQAVIVNMVNVLNYPINIGKINFSIMNVIFAGIVLVITHTLARFWRFVLREKILTESGLNTGLQDSIIMISVYAVWAFGIMLSLHTFGMGTTTLAFAFGALGIGLGFGLQNIFNNFISGIILLFERPIQVGDDVEINGIWATVKKINVRATVVQTYDNASIIIPNSEFISSQVTNWSFNDKRLRRSIDVGVAYGSDIEGVRETLLKIAEKTQKVFKQPKPDVIFRDFGDSALMFRLRVWTDIDNIFKVETAIRFEIDKQFKEKGFIIAFPQRDVHLFTDGSPQISDTTGQEETRK